MKRLNNESSSKERLPLESQSSEQEQRGAANLYGSAKPKSRVTGSKGSKSPQNHNLLNQGDLEAEVAPSITMFQGAKSILMNQDPSVSPIPSKLGELRA